MKGQKIKSLMADISKKYVRFILNLAVIIGGIATLYALSTQPAQANNKYAAIVVDAGTDRVLFSRNADKSLHPASLTKVMTLMLVFDQLSEGKLSYGDRIKISHRAASMVPSKLGLKPGETISVKNAIYALVTKSANDIAVALAEHIEGSESAFAHKMTRKARSIGMNSTRFINASGLHDRKQVSTARDMANMAKYLINNYPEYYHFFSTQLFQYDGRKYRNHNRLLGRYPGVDGLKTGYISASGFNLISTSVRQNQRLIGVVFGGRSSRTRDAHMVDILDNSFDRLRHLRMAQARVPVPDAKPVTSSFAVASSGVSVSSGNQKDLQDFVLPPMKPVYLQLASFDEVNDGVGSREGGMTVASAGSSIPVSHLEMLSRSLGEGNFNEIIGQGDFDPVAMKRIETGLIALSVHTGQERHKAMFLNLLGNNIRDEIVEAGKNFFSGFMRTYFSDGVKRSVDGKPLPPRFPDIRLADLRTSEVNADGNIDVNKPAPNVSIEIGRSFSRDAIDRLLKQSIEQLDADKRGKFLDAVVVPVRNNDRIVFHARIKNLSNEDAHKACKMLENCQVIYN